jgi:hypothetical protein
MIFLNVLFPILVLVSLGYFLTQRGHIKPDMLSKLTFWLLSPSLIFTSLLNDKIEVAIFLEFGKFVLLFTLIFWGIARIASKIGKLTSDSTAAFALAVVFTNGGNYGLPLLLFAYGQDGFSLGVVYLTTSTLLMSTLGVPIATSGEEWSWKPIISIARTPLFHAVISALLVKAAGFEIPLFALRPLQLLADAAIPMMLILLGTQLVGVQLGQQLKLLGAATALRLGLAPLVAWGLSLLLGFSGLMHKVAVIEVSMPSAVNALVLASYYKRDPKFVSPVVLVTTVLSVISLTILLILLGA